MAKPKEERKYQRTTSRKERGDNPKIRRHGIRGLSERAMQFIDEYMVDRNAAAAAQRAGYARSAAAQRGHELLSTPAVQDEIDRRDRERAQRVGVTSDDILRELARIAFFDIGALFKENGTLRTNVHEMSENERRALVNFDIITLDREGNYVVKLNPGNKLKALELLGKNAKLFTDRVEQSGGVNVNYNCDFGSAGVDADADE